MEQRWKDHAVVVGAGMAGLATARVLARHFKRVTVVERDVLVDGPEFRGGVPQGRQLHLLLRRGEDVFESLFPGFHDELMEKGAVDLTWGRDVRWYHYGGWKQRHMTSEFRSTGGTRILMESIVRRRLREVGGVTILEGSVVRELLTDDTRSRLTGIRVERKEGGASTDLTADLVVDCSGRESKAPGWLSALGYTPPVERSINAHLGYASRYYRPTKAARDWKMLVIHATPPYNSRIAAILPVEGDRWHVVLCGANKDYPPTDEDGFLEFTRGLASQEVYEALRDAEPLSPIHGYRRTENLLRRYDKLPRHLEGFLAVGDAVCAFNPVYGQGMSTGALGAELLGRCLADAEAKGTLDGLPRRFHKKLSWILLTPWFLATSEDFRYPKTEGGKAGGFTKFAQGYFDRILRLSTVDVGAYDAFLSVMHMVATPAAVLTPGLILRALTKAPPHPIAEPTPPVATPPAPTLETAPPPSLKSDRPRSAPPN